MKKTLMGFVKNPKRNLGKSAGKKKVSPKKRERIVGLRRGIRKKNLDEKRREGRGEEKGNKIHLKRKYSQGISGGGGIGKKNNQRKRGLSEKESSPS